MLRSRSGENCMLSVVRHDLDAGSRANVGDRA